MRTSQVRLTSNVTHNALNSIDMIESGVVLSFIGDCIMASWGVPYESANDAVNACMAALDMLHVINFVVLLTFV